MGGMGSGCSRCVRPRYQRSTESSLDADPLSIEATQWKSRTEWRVVLDPGDPLLSLSAMRRQWMRLLRKRVKRLAGDLESVTPIPLGFRSPGRKMHGRSARLWNRSALSKGKSGDFIVRRRTEMERCANSQLNFEFPVRVSLDQHEIALDELQGVLDSLS